MKVNLRKEFLRLGANEIGASRTINGLNNVVGLDIKGDIVDLRSLAEFTRKALKKQRGVGELGLQFIERVLLENNLTFGQPQDTCENAKIEIEGLYLVIRLKLTPQVFDQIKRLNSEISG